MRGLPTRFWVIGALGLVCSSAALLSAVRSRFTVLDKAYYADSQLIAFVRPGLEVNIVSGKIGSDGTIIVDFRITDPEGLPLDKEGVYTPGAVNLNFLADVLPKGQSQYTPYTADLETSSITGKSVVIGSPDQAGTFLKVSDGEYIYTFGTRVPSGFDTGATHTIGIYAARDLTEFNLGTNYADATFSFVPNGSPVVKVRDVVKTAACNTCHDPVSFHLGTRRRVEICILCHTAQSADPDTGLSLDFKVMIHKIHQGADLPSVQAGGSYTFIAADGTVYDFSKVVFPADTRNCAACHDPSFGAKQSKSYLSNPSRAACGSCHDNVNFASGENHVNLPELDDNQCSRCHIPQGELEFDASILGAHTIPRFSKNLPGIVFKLIRVENGVAGRQPKVTFTVQNKAGKPITPSTMDRLTLVLAGPASDYTGYVSEDARKASLNGDGSYTHTFQYRIPSTATGTLTVGIEGYRTVKLLPGTLKEMSVRDAGHNAVLNFSADGSPVTPRRVVVALADCNSCHSSLSVHGDNRNDIEQCVLCHNPNSTDSAQRPVLANPSQTVDFRTMVHKIHRGQNLKNDYTVYGFQSSLNNFNGVQFPGDLRDCVKCHVNGSEQVPLPDGLLPVQNPRGFIKLESPTTAACLACHDAKDSASHALANTTQLGEACSVCHASDAEFSVNKGHAR